MATVRWSRSSPPLPSMVSMPWRTPLPKHSRMGSPAPMSCSTSWPGPDRRRWSPPFATPDHLRLGIEPIADVGRYDRLLTPLRKAA